MTRKTLFGDPDFVSVWSVGALGSTARWLEMLVVGVFVFDQTGSPFLVALMLVLRMLPMGIFGLAGGMLADVMRAPIFIRFLYWRVIHHSAWSPVARQTVVAAKRGEDSSDGSCTRGAYDFPMP